MAIAGERDRAQKGRARGGYRRHGLP